ncbi:MAG: bifunctional oligoribonuclease/PAP phosphatase NrnA [Clostridiaceae bacterium]|nr:bifunctional oligoribonuclease/PAP phosphatase NrnA [Clostridiaceae bacterium]
MPASSIVDVLRKSENSIILPHVQADGDALCSSLALAMALKRLNNNAILYLEEEIPRVYSFLPGRDLIKVYSNEVVSPGTVIAVDTGDLERLGKRISMFRDARITVNIDHHPTNTYFAGINYVLPGSSAVGEIIYGLIGMMGVKLDKDISTCLYVAIATDTGGFRYANTTSRTHEIVADLVNAGVNISEISSKIFDSISLGKLKLMGAAINSLELLDGGRIAFITITEKTIRVAGASEDECEGIVNLGKNLQGVEIAVLFREKNGEVKVSLRSNSDADVSIIAGKYGGGGHKNAAGCVVKGELEYVKRRIEADLKA